MKFGPVYSSLNLIKNNLILKYVYNIIMLKTWRRWGYTWVNRWSVWQSVCWGKFVSSFKYSYLNFLLMVPM